MSLRPLPARNSASLLRASSVLGRLSRVAGRLSRLQELLEQHLQPAARPWCRVAALENDCLLLIVSNAQWATHLRYQQQRLLRQLRTSGEFGNLAKILLKVQPTIGEQSPTKARPVISEQAAETLLATAAAIRSPSLRAALERLAQHTARNLPQD